MQDAAGVGGVVGGPTLPKQPAPLPHHPAKCAAGKDHALA